MKMRSSFILFDTLNFFKKPQTSKLGDKLDQLSKLYLNSPSSEKIKKAIEFADSAHQGQYRKKVESRFNASYKCWPHSCIFENGC